MCQFVYNEVFNDTWRQADGPIVEVQHARAAACLRRRFAGLLTPISRANSLIPGMFQSPSEIQLASNLLLALILLVYYVGFQSPQEIRWPSDPRNLAPGEISRQVSISAGDSLAFRRVPSGE